jgi:rubrerythrin
MAADTLLLVYVAGLLATLTGLATYTEARQRRFQPTHSEDRIFRCQRCGYVYTDDPDVDRSRCAQCGRLNGPIEF